MRQNSLMKKYLEQNPSCEKCGRHIGCEVHHIVPYSQGGKDDFDNYMTLCADCHDKEHIKNRSELTKEGIKKAKNAECDKLISVIDLLTKIQEEEPQSVIEIIDIIRSIPARKWERLAVRE